MTLENGIKQLFDTLQADFEISPESARSWLSPVTDHLSLWLKGESVIYAQFAPGELDDDARLRVRGNRARMLHFEIFILTSAYAMLIRARRGTDREPELVIDESHIAARSSITSLTVDPESNHHEDRHGLRIFASYPLLGEIRMPPLDSSSRTTELVNLVPLLRDDRLSTAGAVQTWPLTRANGSAS